MLKWSHGVDELDIERLSGRRRPGASQTLHTARAHKDFLQSGGAVCKLKFLSRIARRQRAVHRTKRLCTRALRRKTQPKFKQLHKSRLETIQQVCNNSKLVDRRLIDSILLR